MFHIFNAMPDEVLSAYLAYAQAHKDESVVIPDFYIDGEGKAFVHNVSFPEGEILVVPLYLDAEGQAAISTLLDEEKAKVEAWLESVIEEQAE